MMNMIRLENENPLSSAIVDINIKKRPINFMLFPWLRGKSTKGDYLLFGNCSWLSFSTVVIQFVKVFN